MKALGYTVFVASCLTMTAARPAAAQSAYSVQSRKALDSQNQPLDQTRQIAQDLVVNSTANFVDSLRINYYFYEPNLSTGLTWNITTATIGSEPPVDVAGVFKLDRTYTGPSLKANYMVSFWVPIRPNPSTTYSFQFTVKANDNRTLTQTDDWSYANNTNYATNSKIVLQARVTDTGPLGGTWPVHDRTNQLTLAKQKIKHVIIIMQENRSFDNYFGSFPSPTGYVTRTGLSFPTPGRDFLGVVSDGVDKAPNGTGERTSPCNTTTWNPQALTVNDAVGFKEDLPHEMVYAKTAFACPATPAAPDRSCNATCAGAACTDTDPLKISDFLRATYNVRGNSCGTSSAGGTADQAFKQTVGYLNSSVIGNYWTIAQTFLLQDRMFEPLPSMSRLSHLYMVSGWSADNCTSGPCTDLTARPNNPDFPTDYIDVFVNVDSNGNNGVVRQPSGSNPVCSDNNQPCYGWKEISTALANTSLTKPWAFYKGGDWNPTKCATGQNCSTSNTSCACYTNPNSSSCFDTAGTNQPVWFWSPLSYFRDVQTKGTTGNVKDMHAFLTDVAGAESSFPTVSWIVPGVYTSEHPNYALTSTGAPTNANSDPRAGQAYVTMILQQIMKNSALWGSSIVLLAWDDWGGYYDHVRPPRQGTKVMYGPRVPGMTISPYLGIGKVDHQTLSFDAYLKLIEDLFLNGARLSGDNRPTPLRENMSVLGNLLDEFDFNRVPTGVPSGFNNLKCHWP